MKKDVYYHKFMQIIPNPLFPFPKFNLPKQHLVNALSSKQQNLDEIKRSIISPYLSPSGRHEIAAHDAGTTF